MTQNEKDREFLDEVFYQMRDGGTQIINEIGTAQLAKLFDLAHRLLTERENAEVIYRDSRAHSEFWTEDEIRGYKNHMKFTKGIWIPDVDGEAE
ncbi:hypothetical protein DUK53_08625 [Listeria sp. SHR_NRA_18]|uniref:hypothetical protein n=1 Tax=Listeria sp. SHR_NRA_18 TaxID=2269046 RepID=UPI00051DB635|nr:hypothetical protein [Listeria sp. SHR_NRA_18]KGL46030.1 hypothetical protein EP56_02840 [Listeriaceae bacterium FSL A5-0209]RQW66692.1 hypothetical protein DUK53_08625 [Listeria sp. SHR_NRA_18]